MTQRERLADLVEAPPLTQDVGNARGPAGPLLLGGVGVAIGLTAVAVVRYPGVLHDSDSTPYLVALLVLIATYVGLGVWGWWARGTSHMVQVVGLQAGLLAGACWAGEVLVGGAIVLDGRAEGTLGRGFIIAALLLTCAGPTLVALRTRDLRASVQAGVWTGMVSGLITFIVLTLMTLTFTDVLAGRSDYQAELARSGAADMATYLVADALAAGIAHLAIGCLLGIGAGPVGYVLGCLKR